MHAAADCIPANGDAFQMLWLGPEPRAHADIAALLVMMFAFSDSMRNTLLVHMSMWGLVISRHFSPSTAAGQSAFGARLWLGAECNLLVCKSGHICTGTGC